MGLAVTATKYLAREALVAGVGKNVWLEKDGKEAKNALERGCRKGSNGLAPRQRKSSSC
jgi:hypothetical protein